MALDKTNMQPEPISVKPAARRAVSMSLPREDDGMVHRAVGDVPNTSAVRYADAQARVFGGAAASPWRQSRGGR